MVSVDAKDFLLVVPEEYALIKIKPCAHDEINQWSTSLLGIFLS
jgi:hypothetical protein